MKFGNEASQYMAHVLRKFAGGELTLAESHAAFQLLCTLPSNTCVKDFMKAAGREEVAQAGLPMSVAEDLAPLVLRLESNLPYAGRFASLSESRGAVAGRLVSHS